MSGYAMNLRAGAIVLVTFLSLVTGLGLACNSTDVAKTERGIVPKSEDFEVITIHVEGKTCDIAYTYIQRGTSQYATGGPFGVLLGCK